MKLPEIKYRQVETVGRHDIAAVGALASAVGQEGRVMQQGMGMLAEVTGDYVVRKENAEYDDQVASMQIEFDEWNAQYGAKDFWTSEEVLALGLPEHLIKRTETTTDASGKQITLERNNIPAYEVYPHLLRGKLAGMAADKSQKISNPHLRQEFTRKANINEANLNMQAAFNAENQQEEYALKSGVGKYKAASDRGDVSAALFFIDGLEIDDVRKEEMRQDAFYRGEYADVTKSIRSNSDETIMTTLSWLEDPQYDGYLPEPQRQAAVGDLRAKLDALGANAEAETTRLEGVRYAKMVEKIKTGGASLAEIQESFDKHVVDPDDAEGWTAPQYTQLMGLQRSYENGVIADQKAAEATARRIENEKVAEARYQEREGRRIGALELAAQNKEYKEANSNFISDVHERIDNDQYDMTDLERDNANYLTSLEDGAPNPMTIDGGQRTAISHHIQERNKQRATKTEKFTRGKEIWEGGSANREYGKDQAAVDEYVETMNITSIDEMVAVAQKSFIMPQRLENMIVGSITATDSKQATAGLLAFKAVNDTHVNGTLDIGEKTRGILLDASYYHSRGTSTEKSFEYANELANITAEDRAENIKLYKREDGYDENISFLKGKMAADESSLYAFDPSAMPFNALTPNHPMSRDYQSLVAKESERTGNLDMSRENAWSIINEVWSPSGVGAYAVGTESTTDARPVKHGVERAMGITTGVANDRLAAFGIAHDLDVDGLVVQWDELTARNDKSWKIMQIDPNTGMPDWVYGADGSLLRWYPDQWKEEGIDYRHDKGTIRAEKFKAYRENFEEREEAYKLANPHG